MLAREIREAPYPVNTTRSGTWWASRAGGKVVHSGNGQAFTPMWSSTWTGFWRKLKHREGAPRRHWTPWSANQIIPGKRALNSLTKAPGYHAASTVTNGKCFMSVRKYQWKCQPNNSCPVILIIGFQHLVFFILLGQWMICLIGLNTMICLKINTGDIGRYPREGI